MTDYPPSTYAAPDAVPPSPAEAEELPATSIESPSRHRADDEDASVGQLFAEVSSDLSAVLRQELELARAEVKAEVAKTDRAARMLGGAGVAGYLVLLFLSIALWWGLSNVMDQGWAALIVAAIWSVIGGALFVTGRRTLRSVNPEPGEPLLQ
jgi:hypothetical protein